MTRTRSPPICAVSWCVAERKKGSRVCAVHESNHFIPDELSAAKKVACRQCWGWGVVGKTNRVCSQCGGTGKVIDVEAALMWSRKPARPKEGA